MMAETLANLSCTFEQLDANLDIVHSRFTLCGS